MPDVIVNSLAEAVAALGAASGAQSRVTLHSAPGAALFLGAGYFLTMIRLARAEVPLAESQAVLDCADAPGFALDALRAGAEVIRIDAPAAVRDKLVDIAGQLGAEVVTGWPADILDLGGLSDPLTQTLAYFRTD